MFALTDSGVALFQFSRQIQIYREVVAPSRCYVMRLLFFLPILLNH